MTAREAASLLATLGTNIGVIVSDIRMPRLDGLQLAALVSERWPTVPLILISGEGGPPPGYGGPFCPKPFAPETLIAAVTALPVPPNAALNLRQRRKGYRHGVACAL